MKHSTVLTKYHSKYLLFMRSSTDLDILCQNALSYGASSVTVMNAKDIVLDPRVRLKCMIPQCINYGRNLMCPPNVIDIDTFSVVISRYTDAILVQYPIPLDTKLMANFKDKNLEDIYDEEDYKKRIVSSERKFQNLMGRLESNALELGYRFAAALSGGPCCLCDECVGQNSGENCRHPFRSRPSMEALGIDVYMTAQNAGLSFEVPAKDDPVWNGLLLVD